MFEFRLLGAVEAHANGRRVGLGPRKQRLTFAVLALEANHPVTVERLVELNWPIDRPRTAEHAIRVSVSLLRSILGDIDPTQSQVTLTAQGAGYVLRIDPQRIDAHRFRGLLRQARTEPDDERRVALLDQGLSLWHGPALDGAASPETQERLGRGLEESRLVAVEDRIDAGLRLGRHRQLLDELTELTRCHPFRERLTCQLMIALYRSGQTHTALEEARRARRRLTDELGIDPSLELQRLEVAILRNDPVLLPRPDRVLSAGPPASAVPAQLPRSVSDFTGRAGQLRWLDEHREDHAGGPVTIALTGAAGVGKTALALYWAHRARERFPDGQLYVDLRGFASMPPVRPEQALARLLRSLGVAAEQVPPDADEAAALYRTLLADKRVLVLLDNASTPDQVRTLLPGAPACLALVTSRDRLSGLVALDGARELPLGVLDAAEARALLGRILGADRISQESGAAAELARLCDHLPLALRIAAINLSRQPERAVADAVTELAGSDRLGALQVDGDGQAAVRAAFDQSYAALDPADQRLFRILGLSPCPDLTAQTSAVLAGGPAGPVQRALDRLERTHLILRTAPGRYGFHDLIRLYARELATPEERDGALSRLFGFYLRVADEAKRLLYPQALQLAARPRPPSAAQARPDTAVRPHPPSAAPARRPLPASAPQARLDPLGHPSPASAATAGFDTVAQTESSPLTFGAPAAALAWLDAERSGLVAAITHAAEDGPREVAWRLADTLRGYLSLRRDHDWPAVAEAARTAAAQDGDLSAQAATELSMAQACQSRGLHQQAFDHYTQALRLARRAGWRECECAVLNNLGNVHWKLGRLQEAADHYGKAIAISRQTGQNTIHATSLANLSMVHRSQGRLTRAADLQHEALGRCRHAGYRNGEAITLANLGEIYHDLGELDRALGYLDAALPLFRQSGNRYGEVLVLTALAAVHRDAGRLGDALDLADQAVDLAVAIGDRRAEADTLNTRATVLTCLGRPEQAAEEHGRALDIAREVGNPQPRLESLIGLAGAHSLLGHLELASAHGREALDVARARGFRQLEEQALGVLATVGTRAESSMPFTTETE
ncbi:AfsR/SARP family transcriptional regulator [Nonomuraea longicatena]|uniref:BTAD domain-containing putative transcriptional regulator n=1 Tax=Nonomuraea longicatena TaxID=83682 RepID=A0ABN1NQD9_9ACTN